MFSLNQVRIILLKTSHPGNIGSTARAMKTMGLKQLYLVQPLHFPHLKANEMASGALDILEQAQVKTSLDEAIADCHFIIGTSARARTIPWPLLSPRELVEKTLRGLDEQHQIAIIFGPEQSGLTNEELHRCHFHVNVPSNPDYSSLNLAAAVQIIAYELRVAQSPLVLLPTKQDPLATEEYIQGFLKHLENVLIQIDFLNPKAPRQLMARLQRLCKRARPDKMEINILRGILSNIEKKI